MNIQDLNFYIWFDNHQDCWKAKAEKDYSRESFATGFGDSPNEAIQDCVVNASVRLAALKEQK